MTTHSARLTESASKTSSSGPALPSPAASRASMSALISSGSSARAPRPAEHIQADPAGHRGEPAAQVLDATAGRNELGLTPDRRSAAWLICPTGSTGLGG
jgi:hypothetical protein